MEWYAIVGANIRRLRDARSWTLEELADRSKIDVGYLGKIERGLKNPTLKKLIFVSQGLEVELSVFFQRPRVSDSVDLGQ